MIQLLILADDFTGGLDTGVQFAQRGIPTRVITDPDADYRAAAGDCRVLVAVTRTRHLPAERAFDAVHRAVSTAAALGIPHIFKKTDSALRGNVGAELTAALRASGARALPFLPALPASGRTTVGGVHYVDGVPVSESPFGRDPFDPVRESDVAALLRAQSDAAISCGDREHIPERDGLWVLDARTDDDLRAAGLRLRETGMLRVCAGCAGFAAQMPELLGLVYDRDAGRWDAVEGVNITLGLPIVRVSVDHGTAFDQAGTGAASELSLINAIDYAIRLAISRKNAM